MKVPTFHPLLLCVNLCRSFECAQKESSEGFKFGTMVTVVQTILGPPPAKKGPMCHVVAVEWDEAQNEINLELPP